MKKYEKPVVLINEEWAEGVYAASGECWTVSVTMSQPDAGGYARFRVKASDPNAGHISDKTVITINFNKAVTSAKFEGFSVSCNGSVVTLTRESHGNAEKSGENYDCDLSVWAEDHQNLAVVGEVGIYCEKSVSVNGMY